MKRILTLPVVLILMTLAFLPLEIFAGEENLIIVQLQEEKDPTPPLDPHGRRSKEKTITCEISSDNLWINSVNADEIFLYEICDESGTIVASFASELEFTNYIFNEAVGIIEIRLYLADYILCGYLEI